MTLNERVALLARIKWEEFYSDERFADYIKSCAETELARRLEDAERRNLPVLERQEGVELAYEKNGAWLEVRQLAEEELLRSTSDPNGVWNQPREELLARLADVRAKKIPVF
jgi:hypothetical protein